MKYAHLYFFSFLITAFLFFSCKNTPVKKQPTMSREAFVALLTDIRLLEGMYSMDFQRIDSSSDLLAHYYDQVFAKHHTTRDAFVENYTAFLTDFEQINTIEDEVMEQLSILHAEIQHDLNNSHRLHEYNP